MKRFFTAFLLFALVTTGLYLTKGQQMTRQTTSSAEIPEEARTHSADNGERTQEYLLTSNKDQASFQLAKQIRDCRNIPANEDQLSTWLMQAQENGEPQAYLDDVLTRYETCKSLNIPNTNYIGLLITAAKQLNDNAISELWSIPFQEYSSVLQLPEQTRAEQIQAKTEFVKLKYELAHQSALQGGELSLQHLVKEYQNYDPNTHLPNLVKALAYANFALSVTQDNDLYRKMDWFKQKLESKLSYNDVEQAQAITSELIETAN